MLKPHKKIEKEGSIHVYVPSFVIVNQKGECTPHSNKYRYPKEKKEPILLHCPLARPPFSLYSQEMIHFVINIFMIENLFRL